MDADEAPPDRLPKRALSPGAQLAAGVSAPLKRAREEQEAIVSSDSIRPVKSGSASVLIPPQVLRKKSNPSTEDRWSRPRGKGN